MCVYECKTHIDKVYFENRAQCVDDDHVIIHTIGAREFNLYFIGQWFYARRSHVGVGMCKSTRVE